MVTSPKAVVTTSWDDRHRLDSRLTELLAEYGAPTIGPGAVSGANQSAQALYAAVALGPP